MSGSDDASAQNQAKEFCAAIGELILWASFIDDQLTKALTRMMALPEHAMIEPLIAQLDARQKSELLKRRAKIIEQPDWRSRIGNWVERAERANRYRNIVAHHSVRSEGGEILLHSNQLGKILASLDTSGGTIRPGKLKGLADIRGWIKEATATFIEGNVVLDNLGRFREVALASDLKAPRSPSPRP